MPTQEALGRGGHGRERDEGVVRVPVVPRQLPAAAVRPAGLPRRRDVRVLRDEERLEAELLERPPELDGMDRVRGREDEDADVHGGRS